MDWEDNTDIAEAEVHDIAAQKNLVDQMFSELLEADLQDREEKARTPVVLTKSCNDAEGLLSAKRAGRPRCAVPAKETDNVEDLSARYRAVSRMAAIGMKNKDIAAELGLHPVTVSQTLTVPAVREHIDTFVERQDAVVLQDTAAKLADMCASACEVVEESLTDELVPSDRRARVAFEVLAINGHSKVQKTSSESRQVVVHTTIDELVARAQEKKKKNGKN